MGNILDLFKHVPTHIDQWLVIQITATNGVNVYRTYDQKTAEATWNQLAWKPFAVMAMHNPIGVCVRLIAGQEWK